MDPACGSGVFLVGAFKKIIKLYEDNGDKITPKLLKEVLTKQIFGIDINSSAINIATFSLYIALLDYLQPKDIEENKFRFPNLINRNLFLNNFFDEKEEFNKVKVDIVIGNPPWASVNDDNSHVLYCRNHNKEISDKQIAQAFIHRASDFIDDNGIVSLIITNSIFYNTNALNFRKQLLIDYDLTEVINFNSVSTKLFANASSPCSIITYKKTQGREKVQFFSFKPNVFSDFSNKIVFDFSQPTVLSKSKLTKDDFLWGIVLYGNQFDYYLIKRILSFPSLLSFLDNNELFIARGYGASSGIKTTSEFLNFPTLNSAKDITPYYIDPQRLTKYSKSELKYERLHDTRIYHNKIKLLISRTFSSEYMRSPVALFFDRILFKNSTICITCKNEQDYNVDKLYYLEAILNSKLYTYYQIHMSTVVKAIQPEIRMDRIKKFPTFPFDKNNSTIKEIVSVSKQIHDIYSNKVSNELGYVDISVSNEKVQPLKDKIDSLIFNLYDLSDVERDTVYYTLEHTVPLILKKKSALASQTDVKEYCNIIATHFNDLINSDELKIVFDIQESFAYYKAVFVIVESNVDYNQKKISAVPAVLELFTMLSEEQFNSNLLINKKVKGFYNNAFYIAKTKDAYNWSRFNAIIDINEFTEDIFSDDDEEEVSYD